MILTISSTLSAYNCTVLASLEYHLFLQHFVLLEPLEILVFWHKEIYSFPPLINELSTFNTIKKDYYILNQKKHYQILFPYTMFYYSWLSKSNHLISYYHIIRFKTHASNVYLIVSITSLSITQTQHNHKWLTDPTFSITDDYLILNIDHHVIRLWMHIETSVMYLMIHDLNINLVCL